MADCVPPNRSESSNEPPSTPALLARLAEIEDLLRQQAQTISVLSASPRRQRPREHQHASPGITPHPAQQDGPDGGWGLDLSNGNHVVGPYDHEDSIAAGRILGTWTTPVGPSPDGIAPSPASAIFSSVSTRQTHSGHGVVPQQQASLVNSYVSSGVVLPPMTIPLDHMTTSGSLLGSKQLTSLMGDFPVDLFLDTEIRRPVPEALLATTDPYPDSTTLPEVWEQETSHLIEAFSTTVHFENPILDREVVAGIYENVLRHGLQRDLDSALCLVWFALGQAVQRIPNATELADPAWAPGSESISLALPILIREYMNTFGTNILLPQSLYLAARYFGYLARPLQAWRFVHMASTNLQHISHSLGSKLSGTQNALTTPGKSSEQAVLRTAWAIFGLECDLIAEHHFPRSGIEHLVDSLPLPDCGQPARTEMLCWLAELSVRRLLNRVHHVLYVNDADTATTVLRTQEHGTHAYITQELGPLLKISAELERQLETWFDLLPPMIKPDLSSPAAWALEQLNILCRYHSAKDIIFRPFVMHVCKLPHTADVPVSIRECCRKCLEGCRAYLDVSERRLRTPCSSGEVIIHSTFASAVVLIVASLCPFLAEYVGDLDFCLASASTTIQRLAFEGSCVESMLWILTAMQAKGNMMRRLTIHSSRG